MEIQDDVMRCLCLNLRRGARQVTQLYDDALRPSGLKATQFTLLAAVERLGRSSLNPLADLLGMDRTTLTRNLAILSREGLVRMEQGDNDRREQWVKLTAKGVKAVKKAMPLWAGVQEEMIRRIDAAAGMPAAKSVVGMLERLAEVSESK